MADGKAAQVAVMAIVVAGLAYLVTSNADSWGDWVVFGAILLTAYGAAVAAYPRLHARRRRTISRSSDPES